MRPLVPTLITDETIEHIHSHSGRGHITKGEIREALKNAETIRRNKKESRADVQVYGRTLDGKKLVIYVTFIDDASYYTEICSARSA